MDVGASTALTSPRKAAHSARSSRKVPTVGTGDDQLGSRPEDLLNLAQPETVLRVVACSAKRRDVMFGIEDSVAI
jgi:hypothetical protein